MIRVISGYDRRKFAREMEAFHQIRKRVFFDKFGWEVPVINSWEIDGYDALDPVYLLSVNEAEQVVGGLRLLPTMGFNMLNDTFPELLPEGKRIESPLIWESSRFCIDSDIDIQIGPKRIHRAIAELGLGLNEIGASIGLSHIVTVYDAMLHRHLTRMGCGGEPISEPKRIGKALAYAVFYEIGPEAAAATRAASGILGSVLEPARESLAQPDWAACRDLPEIHSDVAPCVSAGLPTSHSLNNLQI